MTLKLKALALALMATLALGAVAASGAAAAEFRSEVQPTILTGTDSFHADHTFSLSGISVTCTDTNLRGTVTLTPSTTIKLFPAYEGCGDNIGHSHGEVSFDTAGCWYEIHSHTNATKHLPVTIDCTPGVTGIVITDPSCTLTVGPQTAQEGIQVTNLGTGSSRDITFHVTAKVGVAKGKEAGCFLLGTTLTWSGTGTLRAFEDKDATHIDPPDSNHVYSEGFQIGFWWE